MKFEPKCWLKDNNLWGTGLENPGQMLQPWVNPHSYPGGPREVRAAHRHPLPQCSSCCVYSTQHGYGDVSREQLGWSSLKYGN